MGKTDPSTSLAFSDGGYLLVLRSIKTHMLALNNEMTVAMLNYFYFSLNRVELLVLN